METILRYFPDITPQQKEQFESMGELYRDWNEKINVISRKDMDNLYLHHILHSLAISKAVRFPAGATVLDVGTGGGFPGIPLAVMFPQCGFTLCDSIGKKIKVAEAVAQALGLENVSCVNCRAEDLGRNFDFVVSRAVADLSVFYPWIRNSYKKAALYLKGGELEAEIAECVRKNKLNPAAFCQFDISNWFKEDYFEGKKVVVITKI